MIKLNVLILFVTISYCQNSAFGADASAKFNERLKQITKEKEAPTWTGNPVHIDLTKYLDNDATIEFATDDSGYIIACEQNINKYAVTKCVVFDCKGNLINATTENGKRLKVEFLQRFPHTASLQKMQSFITINSFNLFTEDYAFSPDLRFGVKVDLLNNIHSRKIELWNLDQPKILWKIQQNVASALRNCDFISWEKTDCVLMAFEKCFIISRDSGQILDAFPYGPLDTEESRKLYKNKFKLKNIWDGDVSLTFEGFFISYSDPKRWIASGDMNSRRIRIVSVDSPHLMVTELNSEDHPMLPSGGMWHNDGLKFACDGRYLIAKFQFTGHDIKKAFFPTEIYDVNNWKVCWSENKEEIDQVTLSSDGKWIAYTRGKTLEIGPFVPQSESQ